MVNAQADHNREVRLYPLCSSPGEFCTGINRSSGDQTISIFPCSPDYLTIFDEHKVEVGTHCGLLTGKYTFAYGNYAVIRIRSSSKERNRRFRIIFAAVQPGK